MLTVFETALVTILVTALLAVLVIAFMTTHDELVVLRHRYPQAQIAKLFEPMNYSVVRERPLLQKNMLATRVVTRPPRNHPLRVLIIEGQHLNHIFPQNGLPRNSTLISTRKTSPFIK